MYIGLTGLIASGKSTVARYLEQKGAYIIDADKISRLCTEKGGECYEAILETFGKSILNKDGEINRKALAGVVFCDKQALSKLNAIVHPVVNRKMFEIAEEYKEREKDAIIVFDVPLLIEVGMHEKMDEVWVVTASEDVILQRASKRSAMTEKEVQDRMKNQANEREKLKFADEVIDNSGNLKNLYERLDMLFERIKEDNA